MLDDAVKSIVTRESVFHQEHHRQVDMSRRQANVTSPSPSHLHVTSSASSYPVAGILQSTYSFCLVDSALTSKRATTTTKKKHRRESAVDEDESSGGMPKVKSFLGNCFAVLPTVVVTAGHHCVMSKDDPAKFCIAEGGFVEQSPELLDGHGKGLGSKRSRDGIGSNTALSSSSSMPAWQEDDQADDSAALLPRTLARVSHFSKSFSLDVMVIFLKDPLPNYFPIYGRIPMVSSTVWTCYISPWNPLSAVTASPGVVMSSSEGLCRTRNTHTARGASGAPVVSGDGERIVGLHLSTLTVGNDDTSTSSKFTAASARKNSNIQSETRLTEFVSAKAIVKVFMDAGIQQREYCV